MVGNLSDSDMGASPSATGLAGAEAPEPHSRLGPTGGIPSAAHTPGPWEVGGEWPQIVAIYDANYAYIAHANTGIGADWLDGNPLGRGVAQANARLIAAAPDLLEALQAVELARHSDEPGHWQRATDLTDAALAKATGAA